MPNYLNTIHWFDAFEGWNPHAFLSNFFEGDPIVIDGAGYQTGEHAFQAYKTGDEKWYNAIKDAKDPGVAKALGRRAPLRPDWELVKYDVMRMVVVHKFTLARQEGQLLLMTGDALLTEGTWWGDSVWGVEMTRKQGHQHWPGRNWLGTLLMARRAELRAIQAGAPIPRTQELIKFSREIIDPGFARSRPKFSYGPAASPKKAQPHNYQAPLFSTSTPEPAKDAVQELIVETEMPFTATQTDLILRALADYRITLEEQRKEVPGDLDEIEELLGAHLDLLNDITPYVESKATTLHKTLLDEPQDEAASRQAADIAEQMDAFDGKVEEGQVVRWDGYRQSAVEIDAFWDSVDRAEAGTARSDSVRPDGLELPRRDNRRRRRGR